MWPISIKHLVITSLVNYKGFIQWSQKKELSFSSLCTDVPCTQAIFLLRNHRGKPRAGTILPSWPLGKPLRPRLCEKEWVILRAGRANFCECFSRKTLTLLPRPTALAHALIVSPWLLKPLMIYRFDRKCILKFPIWRPNNRTIDLPKFGDAP